MKHTQSREADPNPLSHTVDEMPTMQYAIAVSESLQQRRTRTLKHGDTFAVFDHRGDMGGEPGNPEGLYYRDTRMLSQFQLLLEEARPLLLSSMTQDDNAVFTADLSNPDLMVEGKIALRRETVHVNRIRFVWSGACYERVVVRNFSDRPLYLRLTYRFASDFADLFEVRGERRAAHGEARAALQSDHGVALTYAGLDRMERSTHIAFAPSPKTLTTARAVYELLLKPRATRRIFVRCAVDRAENDWGGRLFYRRMRAARHALRESSQRAASIEGSNSVFNEIMRRSVSDLYMLVTDTPQGPYPYAGIPWFSTPFGRDAIITALMMLWVDPAIAKGVLKFLAYTQATTVEPDRDAEPGKILHEMRHGEMANLREVPFGRYYGSVDATPLFVLLLGEYFRRTARPGDRQVPVAQRAGGARVDRPLRRSRRRWLSRVSPANQGGARQSGLEGFVRRHLSSRRPNGPGPDRAVRSSSLRVRRQAPRRHARGSARPHAARRRARGTGERLRQDFEDRFWCEELSVYALALDGGKEPCRVVSSNSGQVLLTGIASAERAQRVAHTLLEPSMFSGWGVRTVATSEARYNPMSYHNGSVWPHDNGLIAMGFARYGLKQAASQVFNALFDAATYMDLRRLPELYCGFVRIARNAPTQYPVACSPQAWASAAPLCLLQATLGLELLDRTGEIKFYRPTLPDFLDYVHLRNLRLSSGSADVLLHRHGEHIAVTVTRREGDVVAVVRY